MSSYGLFSTKGGDTTTRLPRVSSPTSSSSKLVNNSERNSDLASFLSTSAGAGGGSAALSSSAAYPATGSAGQSLISGSHAGAGGLSYGLSAPHYVTLEEFGQLRRAMEKERSYRDDVISRMKTEILELRERNRAATFTSGGGGSATTLDPSLLDEAAASRNHHSSNSALMSSPPRTTSRLHGALFAHEGQNNNNSTGVGEHNTSGGGGFGGSGTLINRIEHLEAFKLSVPPQLDAMEERVRTIVEERMREVTAHSQLAGLLSETAALTKRIEDMSVVQDDISNMLEHDVARNAPVQESLERLSSSVQALANDVEQLHGFRLTTDDARIKLENDMRSLRSSLLGGSSSVEGSGGGGGGIERMIEAAVERHLAVEREETRDMVRRESRRLRDEILDSHTQMRVEIEAAKRQLAVRNAHITNSELETELGNPHAVATPQKSGGGSEEDGGYDRSNNNNNISNTSSPVLLRNQQQHHKQQEQLVEQRLRHLEAQLSSQLSDATRTLESKLLTRVREMTESSRSVLGEEVTERLDVQLDNVQTTLREDLVHQLTRHMDGALKKESERLRRMVEGGGNNNNLSNSRAHSRSNTNEMLGFYGPGSAAPSAASGGAPDIILDGVDLFLREVPLDNAPLFAQCAELISDCRARGRTTPADAMLLLFKFLRGHLSNFSLLAQNVGELKYAVVNNGGGAAEFNTNNNISSSGGGGGLYQQQQQKSDEQLIEESGIIANIVQDIDAMVAQFARGGNGGSTEHVFTPCEEYLEYCKSRDADCSSAMALQLVWTFLRGYMQVMGSLGGRIEAIERRQ